MIPVNEPLILERDIELVTQAVRSGWVSSAGEFIDRLEKEFAKYCNRKHAIAVNNGTSALILAIRALDLPKGSEVILPTHTIISCALACIYNDLVPVFVDVEADTWNMNTSLIEAKVSDKTKAIMPVHIFGHPVDMDQIIEIATKNGLMIIEDFAQAIGSEYKNKICGSFGEISCASFYANKTITTGEGGICLTDDDLLAERLKSFRNLAFVASERFRHEELGFNFRITNLQAALGVAQLERVEDHVEKKHSIAKKYKQLLGNLEDEGLIQLPIERNYAKNTYWMYGLVLTKKSGLDAKALATKLQELGIQTRPFFYPLHQQPAFEKFEWFEKDTLAVSEEIYKQGLYLPTGLALAGVQQEEVGEKFIYCIEKNNS